LEIATMTNPNASVRPALEYAIERCGGNQAALARCIGARPQEVWNWLNRPNARIPAEYCPALEVLTDGVKRRWDFRPIDWKRIWPELAAKQEGEPC
jgi:DNA-binding transcriptional regulator YdaS (Cro superfamily)